MGIKNLQKYHPAKFILVLIMLSLLMAGCNHSKNSQVDLQKQIDSLNDRVKNTYAPGLGDFMASIQLHHAKLWFAGKNENWELANFEMEEIQEALEDIRKYNGDRPEIKDLPIIINPLDNLKAAITSKNQTAFKNSFILLTNSCNNCHQVTKHGFNVIKVPDIPPVTNQSFEKH